MIGTDDAFALPLALQENHHAVQADIGEGLDRAIALPDGGNRLVANLCGNIAARFLERIGAANANPFAHEDAFQFKYQKLL